MKLDHHQAGTCFECALLRALPRTEERRHTPFVPACPDVRRSMPCRSLLKTAGVTLPGIGKWRRSGKTHYR